jgi:formylglycine-generating enzyme required for sulfatase activity
LKISNAVALSALALSAAAVVLGGCAGESFGVGDPEPVGQGGSEFPPLDTTSGALAGAGGNAGGAGAAGENAGAGGSSGAAAGGSAGAGGAAASEPTLSPCGELRGAAGADDLEVCIEASSFTMGDSDAGVPSGYTVHGPEHRVTLSAYVLDAYEVTVARYRACVAAGACAEPLAVVGQGCTYTTDPGTREQHPVTCVSWDDAIAFCDWDGGRRLPTEAEWERAARGTESTRFPWGDDVSCSKAVFGGNSQQQQCPNHVGQTPRAVGSTPLGVSGEGAFDLTGNAWEWVNDWFGPYSAEEVTDPTGPDTGSVRVLRGGNWQTATASSAAFMRRAEAPAAIAPTSFRCARSIAAP